MIMIWAFMLALMIMTVTVSRADPGICTSDGCVDNRCNCSSGFKEVTIVLCVKVLGSNCTANEDCSGVLNTTCKYSDGFSKCVCQEGFDVDGVSCSKALHRSCSSDSDCLAAVNSICLGDDGKNTCQCPTGYLDNEVSCLKGIGSTCKTNEDCTAIVPNTECNSDTKLCTCKVGYAEANATCQKVIGMTCLSNQDCAMNVPSTECGGEPKTCNCIQGFTEVNNTCYEILQYTCDNDETCTVLMNNTACSTGKICKCAINHIVDNKVCKTAYGKPCLEDSDCVSNGQCQHTTRQCSCRSTYKEKAGLCVSSAAKGMQSGQSLLMALPFLLMSILRLSN